MHFHLPKPLHGWREFAGEVTIIVIGVLIALTAEQAVEAMHWRSGAAEAEDAMKIELADDDAPQGFERLAFSPCIDAQLNRLQAALVAERDHGLPFSPAKLTTPHFFTWDSDAFARSQETGALSHMATERAYAWSSPYMLMPDIDAAQVREQVDYGELQMIDAAPPHPSEQMRTQLLEAIAKARADNALLTQLAHSFFRYAGTLHVSFTDAERNRYVTRDSYLFPACGAYAAART